MRTTRAISKCCLVLAAAIALRAGIIDRIAVSVGTDVITTSDIEREIRVTSFLDAVKPDLSPQNRKTTADRIVEQRLVRRELKGARYPVPGPAEIESILATFRRDHYPGSDAYERALATYGITEQDLKDELLWQRTLLAFVDVRFRPAIQVTEEEIKDYFDKAVAPAVRAARPGEQPALDDYRARINETLTGQRQDSEMDRWLKEARRRTDIMYHEEAFQ